MLQVGFIRQNADLVKERLVAKYFGDVDAVDKIISLDEEVRKLIDNAYQITKKLLTEKKGDVEKLAKELLKKEVLFKSDVEALIGKRPYEEKKALDIVVDAKDTVSDAPDTKIPEELKTPPVI